MRNLGIRFAQQSEGEGVPGTLARREAGNPMFFTPIGSTGSLLPRLAVFRFPMRGHLRRRAEHDCAPIGSLPAAADRRAGRGRVEMSPRPRSAMDHLIHPGGSRIGRLIAVFALLQWCDGHGIGPHGFGHLPDCSAGRPKLGTSR